MSASGGAVCDLEWCKGALDDGFDVSLDQPCKVFHGDKCECYGAIFIWTGCLGVLGHRDYWLKHAGIQYYKLHEEML
jgi:hypothetical protein